MKHISPNQVSEDTPVRAPTRRAIAKQQTRAKVLAAARKLFSEEGYEGATIRDIAAAAGMSTGAVFANFTDKSDLFGEIMSQDFEALLRSMREAAARGGDVEGRLLNIFMAGYAFYQKRLPLARAALGVSWTPDGGPALRSLPQAKAIARLFADELRAAVGRGELTDQADLDLRGETLHSAYLANYAQLIFEGWTLDALESRVRDQVRMLLASARRR